MTVQDRREKGKKSRGEETRAMERKVEEKTETLKRAEELKLVESLGVSKIS